MGKLKDPSPEYRYKLGISVGNNSIWQSLITENILKVPLYLVFY